jgi:transposase
MARAYSLDLRERVMHAVDAGLSSREIGNALGISIRTIDRWKAQRSSGGSLAPRTAPGRVATLTADDRAALVSRVHAVSDATLADYAAWLQEQRGVTVSVATMSRELRALGLTRKKRP